MNDLSQSLHNPRPKLPVDPLVKARLQDEFNAIDRIQNPIIKGMVLKTKVMVLHHELRRLGYPIPPTPAKPNDADLECMKNAMRAVLQEQQPKAEPLRIGIKDLAKRLGKSERTIAEWTRLRKIPSEKIGRNLMFDVKAVDAAITKYRRGAS